HRAVGVEPGGGDADLGTQPELAAIGEAGRGVDHHRGRVDLVDEAVGRLGIAGDDGFSVIGAPALDVADRAADAVDHSDGADQVQVFGCEIFVGGCLHAGNGGAGALVTAELDPGGGQPLGQL